MLVMLSASEALSWRSTTEEHSISKRSVKQTQEVMPPPSAELSYRFSSLSQVRVDVKCYHTTKNHLGKFMEESSIKSC